MIRYQGEAKELGGAEVQEEEAKEQATWEEEPQEDKAKKNKASGRGTTALTAVLPRWPRYYRAYYRTYYRGQQRTYGSGYGTTAATTAGNRGNTVVVTVVAAVLPHPRYYRANHGTTVLPARRNGSTIPVSESGPP